RGASVHSTPDVPLAEDPRPTPGAAPVSPSDVPLLRAAIRTLRIERNPTGALKMLDQLAIRTPSELTQEADLIRIEALLGLGDRARTLALLDRLHVQTMSRADELLTLRADLRAGAKRCAEALHDYEEAISRSARNEAALYGRASCQYQL